MNKWKKATLWFLTSSYEKEEIHAIKKDIKVVEENCYLGMTITKRNCLEKHKQLNLNQAKNLVNITHTILGTSCSLIEPQ